MLLLLALGQALPVFPVRTDLVVLHALVTDRDGRRVSGLTPDAFRVWEDDAPQTIRFFAHEEAPATIGLVLDVSSSMFADRESVLAATASFASGIGSDERFALVFDREVRAVLPPEVPFTQDAAALRHGLTRAIATGGLTAFHDAVVAGLRHVRKGSHARRALIVVGDGGDNASAESFRQLLRRVAASGTTIYTVALVNPVDPFASPRHLAQLARASGGLAFQPRTLRGVEDAIRLIEADVRTAYTIGYAPAQPPADGEQRRIRVAARARDGKTLTVHTRQGYVVEQPETRGSGRLVKGGP